MLRQIYILKSGESAEILYQHHYSRAYTKDDFETMVSKIKDIIENPMPNQFYHRPLMDFQIIYGNSGPIKDIFYIFVTDLADRFKYVEDEIRNLSKELGKLGNDLSAILEDSEKKNLIEGLLAEIHSNLHPKIALVGPKGSGKTSLAELLKIDGNEPKDIMTFAQVRLIKIDELVFDLWDFILDDFSPLWNNFIRGSDLVLLVYDASQFTQEEKIIQFINLFKREAKYSKVIILLSHKNEPEAISEDRFLEQFGELIESSVFSYEIEEENTDGIVRSAIIDALMLKKPLPDNFRTLLIETNTDISNKNYLKAIPQLKELVNIAIKYQEVEYAETFEKKIAELQQKYDEMKKQEEIEKRKIKAPEQIKFTQKLKVKSLPTKKAKQKKKDNKEDLEENNMSISEVEESIEKEESKPTTLVDIIVSNHEKSKKKKLEEKKIEEIKPKEIKLEDKKIEETKIEEIKTEETYDEETYDEETKIKEIKTDGIKAEKLKLEDKKIEEKKAEEPELLSIPDKNEFTKKTEEKSSTTTPEITSESRRKFKGIKDNRLTFEKSPLVDNKIVRKPTQTSNKPVVTENPDPSIPSITDDLTTEKDKYTKLEDEKLVKNKEELFENFKEKEVRDPDLETIKTPPLDGEERLKYEVNILYNRVLELGQRMRPELCRSFIYQIRAKLKKNILSEEEIFGAADIFVKKLSARKQ